MNVCRDTSDAVALYLPQRLYLKPMAKLNISVQLPPVKVHGKSISNWELMEKLRKTIQPETFSAIKVSKNSSDVIRFDAEIDNKDKLERVISRLDDRTIKLNDYPDALKVRASEAKLDFPSRHSWDAFFRDAPNMDEMKAGERPDTIYLANLPIKWFVNHRDRNDDDALPNESIFRKVFEKFGKVRHVDIPLADPFRKEMKAHMTGIQANGSDSQVFFEAYVQFSEYVAFVRAMDALRGMKLVRRSDDLAECVNVSVDFDRTKHMTDAALKRRAIVRDRLAERQRSKAEKEREEKDRISKKEEREREKAERSEQQKLEGMREREERRKKKQLAKLMARERGDVKSAVAEEERKLVTTQRRLQAIRLMEELFSRIQIKNVKPRKDGARERYSRQEADAAARERIVQRIKQEQEAEMDKQRQRLQRAYEGSIVLRAVLDTKKPSRRSPSVSSVSSEESASQPPAGARRVKKEKMTTPEREHEMQRAMYAPGMAPPYGYPYQFPAPAYAYQPPPSMDMYYNSMGRGYYAPPPEGGYAPRGRFPGRRGRGRSLYRGGPRMPYFEGPNAPHEYYKYFKRLSEAESANQHDDRMRSRSRSRRRSYSRSRSRSRSHHRRYSRSRSRSSRSRSSRSRSRRRRSYSRSRSHSRRRSRSRTPRSRSRRSRSRRSRSRSHARRSPSRSRRSPSPKKPENSTTNSEKEKQPEKTMENNRRSKSWSLPKETDKRKSWSKSPSKEQ